MAMDTYHVTVTGDATGDCYQATAREFDVAMSADDSKYLHPNEALLEALGSCESIVMAAFNQQQGFDYHSLYLTTTGQQNLQACLDEITVDVHFKTAETKQKCLEFVDFTEHSCPVMDNLTNTVPIKRTAVSVVN